VEEKFEYIK
jgi:mitogen-activated protein kinase 1/3